MGDAVVAEDTHAARRTLAVSSRLVRIRLRIGAMMDLVRSKREQILKLARRHGVTGVRVFGSMARGDAGPQSDVDLLIEVGAEPSPWFPGGLVAELEELLGRRVQVITEGGLDELLRDRVLNEAVPL
jgi:hypothetical protein